MTGTETTGKSRRIGLWAAGISGTLILAGVAVLGAFPVGVLKAPAEARLSKAYGAPVEIGSLTRREAFSFSPEVSINNLRIAQPAQFGEGDMIRLREARARISVFSLISGKVSLPVLHIAGLDLALVRDAEGNSNWGGKRGKRGGRGARSFELSELVIQDSHISLHDEKRKLDLAGSLSADRKKGLVLSADGTFNKAPAKLNFAGGALAKGEATKRWPFKANLTSDLLVLDAEGAMDGALNLRDMNLTMHARAPSLKQLDYIIEAGLFGTQPIDLTGAVRHQGHDWFIDSLKGRVGHSQIVAKAQVLKRDGRTKIEGTVRAPRLDFDDLADDAGLARARARSARIGPRIIPSTRIDLSKMGPTDGTLRFTVDRILVKGGSVFRSFSGKLSLDHRVLRIDDAHVGLDKGRLTGWVQVDSREKVPVLSTELRVEGSSLEALIGDAQTINGPLRGLVRISGPGTTIRDAFARADGKIAFVAGEGEVRKTAAFLLGHDLGRAIRQQVGKGEAKTPLRCAILAFKARRGVLRPDPLLVETDISTGRGSGEIVLDGETINLAINGTTVKKARLELVDPVRVIGTLSQPEITLDNKALEEAGSVRGVLRAVGHSIGHALGLDGKDKDQAGAKPAPVDCRALSVAALK